jgi:hypothetical protein
MTESPLIPYSAKEPERSGTAATQPHYTIAELARMWRLSDSTILRLFKSEPGVLRIGNVRSRKRTKISLRIPHDIAERVHARLTQN